MELAHEIFDVVVIGGSNIDFSVRCPNHPRPGETAQGNMLLEAPGGKGANQAIAAARLGSKVAIISKIGADSRGDLVLDNLRREMIDTTYIFRDKSVPTGVALISIDQRGEKQITWAPGANHALIPTEIRKAKNIIENAKIVLLQLELPLESIAIALEIAASSKRKIILDPAPAASLSKELLRHIDVIRPNGKEAEFLTGILVHDRASAKMASAKLLLMGVKAAIVQAGNEGNLLLTHEGETWLPQIPVTSIDATGAGDALSGALASALAAGYTLQEASRFGNAAAAFKTTVLGAQAGLPTWDMLLSFLKAHQIT